MIHVLLPLATGTIKGILKELNDDPSPTDSTPTDDDGDQQ